MSKDSSRLIATEKKKKIRSQTRSQTKTPSNASLTLSVSAARRVYKRYPNVVGISTGIKFVQGRPTEHHDAIHFYVRRKLSKNNTKRRLPRFIYGRFKNGKINHQIKFKTDVIEVGRVKSVCGSGTGISSSIGLTRQNGTITLLFKNKAASDSHYYVLSCAHVLGDIDRRTQTLPLLESDCAKNALQFGQTVFAAVQEDSVVIFDIAIGRVDPLCLPLPDLHILDTRETICSFMPTDQITVNLPVSCALRDSDLRTAVVASRGGSVDVEYRRGVYEVQNAWLIKAESLVEEGASGGLVYQGNVAIGIIFASSESNDGWAWFHPLRDSISYLQRHLPFDLTCF